MTSVRLRGHLDRLRRPIVITASVAAIATGFFPVDGASTNAAPNLRRVIATPAPIHPFAPVRLAIPKIGVDVSVEPVWTQADGAMAVPSPQNAGWWAGRKAGKGNVLIDAHHDWNGRTGPFYRLANLKKGDEVVLVGDNPKKKKLTYRVTWVKNYDRDVDATDLLGNESGNQVATLITCGGTFDTIARTHRERVVARAKLVTT
jgi:LPXTG-site transpeptidase (sortase) family protein